MKTIDNYINEKLILSTGYTHKPKDTSELVKIIKKRLKEDKDADFNDIDVSGIIDMRWLFSGLNPHNIYISEWDMSNVTTTLGMFYGCENFNSDLSNWDVSNVENMKWMFEGCENFNSDLSNWDVSNVKDMKHMFYGCKSLKNKPSWYK